MILSVLPNILRYPDMNLLAMIPITEPTNNDMTVMSNMLNYLITLCQ